MKYTVWVSNVNYGVCHVEAESEDDAQRQAELLWKTNSIDYFSEELTDLTVEEESD